MKNALALAAMLVLVLALAPAAHAHLVTRPAEKTLSATAKSQAENLAHARYVARHGKGPHVRWHRLAVSWLSRELRETRAAIRRRSEPRTWLAAVDYVERYFPGHRGWLLSCSATGSEGGWGRFVYNRQGSGAGGWLQFMSGTFYGVIDEAIARARARGMHVPSSARSWYSPLGQAIAAVEMLRQGRRGEWTGSGC